jgi:hypothetical protein
MSGNGVNQDHWSIIGQDVGGHPKQWIALFVVCADAAGAAVVWSGLGPAAVNSPN